MPASFKQFGLRMINGNERSVAATSMRWATRFIEPFYSSVMRVRNACYDWGIFHIQDLKRPTISVGNITTGGTGKTPVVQWLCQHLQKHGRQPAVLLRGYGKGLFSDEAQLLQQALPGVEVRANPSRIAAAAQVLKDHPQVDLFVLDDAFQHRKVRRDINLVLIGATEPFGYGHVLPRGLLREPLSGLKRADAFLITRCSLVSPEKIAQIDQYLISNHPAISIFHADHELAGLWLPVTNEHTSLAAYEGERVFLTAGIGDPAAFNQQIAARGCHIVGSLWFADHHVFTTANIVAIDDAASAAGADIILTTEKDWVKMKTRMPQASQVAIGVVKLKIVFRGEDEQSLIKKLTSY